MSEPVEDEPQGTAISNHVVDALQAVARRVEVARRLESGGGEAVLRSIVDAAVTLFEAEASSIALYDPAVDRLVFRVAAGERGQGVLGLSVPTSEGLVGYVYTTGQALALADVVNDTRFGRSFAEQTSYIPRGIVAVPLLDDDGTIGVLEVLDKRDQSAFTLRDIELASVFATQATVAIRSSRMERDTAQLLSSVLTGLLGDDAKPGQVDEVVSAAVSDLDVDDGRLWALADQVARLRRADPDKIDLVTEIIALLIRQTDRVRGTAGRSRER